ncbi:hypothetical protein [Ruicaihuangia caeni]|uniref:Uncharacterized protein n=1 Tax=Ruicaihuangia caeni TaxID=3042517 RepID=A0AAW6T511_9MICO|nr:hypothetical protein [Klugiella sp. YN-L-19]MDI2098534.1 hypothetical protein [Klugiella sp. YN-L-19]
MADLQVQTALLQQLEDDLLAIATEYENADDFSASVAAAVGDDGLEDRVREFSRKWNDRRKNMTEQVKALYEQVKAIRENLDAVDQELVRALEEAAAETAANAPSAVPA